MYMHVINPVRTFTSCVHVTNGGGHAPSVVSTTFIVQEAFKLVDSDSDSLHYVYACRKHGLSAADRQ